MHVSPVSSSVHKPARLVYEYELLLLHIHFKMAEKGASKLSEGIAAWLASCLNEHQQQVVFLNEFVGRMVGLDGHLNSSALK